MIAEILSSANDSNKSSYTETKSESRTTSRDEIMSGSSLDDEAEDEVPVKKNNKATSSLEDLYADL